MVRFNSLAIGFIVLTVDCFRDPMTSAAPIATPNPRQGQERTPNRGAETKEEMSQEYLIRFGHLRQSKSKSPSDQELRSAIRSLQRYAGINRSGVLDAATENVMHRPRCGLPDDPSTTGRKKRYSLSGSVWPKTSLYYRFQSFTAKMKPWDLTSVFESAFQIWSAVVPISFTQTYTTSLADIEVLFSSFDHGDGFPFDGPGGILAHTFAPTDGRMHFDESEDWTIGMTYGIDLRQVAAHEIGHAIGLGHSSVPGALMSPFYPGYSAEIQMTQDDRDAIQSLYGIPPNYVGPPSNDNNPSTSSPSSSSSTTTTTTTTTTATPTTIYKSSITSPTTTMSTTISSSSSSSTTTFVQKLLMTRYTPVARKMTPVPPNYS